MCTLNTEGIIYITVILLNRPTAHLVTFHAVVTMITSRTLMIHNKHVLQNIY